MTPTRPQPPFDPDPLDYMCPNCVTPWKCNGPHIPDAYVESESAGPDRGWLWILTVVVASVIIGILIAIAMLAASRSALGPPLPGGRELVRAQTGALHTVSGPVTSHPADARQSVPRGGAPVGELPGGSARPGSDTSTVIGEPLYVEADSAGSLKVLDLPDTAIAPLRGWATWYDAPSIRDAAAGPALRRWLGRDWRGSWVVVRRGDASVRVRLTDWCACGSRNGAPTLLDLDDRAFARLGRLSAGVLRVWIEGADDEPLPTLPATSTEEDH